MTEVGLHQEHPVEYPEGTHRWPRTKPKRWPRTWIKAGSETVPVG